MATASTESLDPNWTVDMVTFEVTPPFGWNDIVQYSAIHRRAASKDILRPFLLKYEQSDFGRDRPYKKCYIEAALIYTRGEVQETKCHCCTEKGLFKVINHNIPKNSNSL